jgi:hypothetical protein
MPRLCGFFRWWTGLLVILGVNVNGLPPQGAMVEEGVLQKTALKTIPARNRGEQA